MPITTTSTGKPKNKLITLAEAKQHCKIYHTNEDAYVQDLINAVDDWANGILGRSLLNTQYTWKLDRFPPWHKNLYVPFPPLVSVESVTYIDTDESTATWSSTQYTVDIIDKPGKLYPNYQEIWPITLGIQNAITVTFTAGYGTESTDVPPMIHRGMLSVINHLYVNRQDVVVGSGFFVNVPKTADYFLTPYIHHRFEGL